MYRKTILWICCIAISLDSVAQQVPGNSLRIADSLTAKERTERNPVLLRSELDSLIRVYAPVQAVNKIPEKTSPQNEFIPGYLAAGLGLLIFLSGWSLFLLYRQRRSLKRTLRVLEPEGDHPLPGSITDPGNGAAVNGKGVFRESLPGEFRQPGLENEELKGVIKTYNGIQQDFDSLKQVMREVYKVKNYPGYDRSSDEMLAIKNVLEKEGAVAEYAYEKFLKPVLALADSNKNHPSRMNNADRDRLFDLLLSLSLFYIEYLYLRVRELSVGGTMVERFSSLTNGQALRKELLKQLNTESGSRALVLRMALNKWNIKNLTYPVFDETNLNPS